jgi:general stress protein CsbA
MAWVGAGLIVVAAVALSSVNYLKNTAFWTLIGIAAVCFIAGILLYFYAIRQQRKKGKK